MFQMLIHAIKYVSYLVYCMRHATIVGAYKLPQHFHDTAWIEEVSNLVSLYVAGSPFFW